MFRSPLMIGANLTKSDAWTTSLLTNAEVIAVDQASDENRAVITTESTVVWTARADSGGGRYVAVFNLRDSEQQVGYVWNEIGLEGGAKYSMRDLWERKDLGSAESLRVTLGGHGCALYRVSR
jgi:alpha-galactosidase